MNKNEDYKSPRRNMRYSVLIGVFLAVLVGVGFLVFAMSSGERSLPRRYPFDGEWRYPPEPFTDSGYLPEFITLSPEAPLSKEYGVRLVKLDYSHRRAVIEFFVNGKWRQFNTPLGPQIRGMAAVLYKVTDKNITLMVGRTENGRVVLRPEELRSGKKALATSSWSVEIFVLTFDEPYNRKLKVRLLSTDVETNTAELKWYLRGMGWQKTTAAQGTRIPDSGIYVAEVFEQGVVLHSSR